MIQLMDYTKLGERCSAMCFCHGNNLTYGVVQSLPDCDAS